MENKEFLSPIKLEADAPGHRHGHRVTAIIRQIRKVSKAQVIDRGAKLAGIGKKSITRFMSKVRNISRSGHST